MNVKIALAWLKANSSEATLKGMARYGIPSKGAFGVPVGVIQKYGKSIGRDQKLAEALWNTGQYEARLLATFVGDPETISAATMERWCRDFDSWAICDTACFKLFDQSPHAWKKVGPWMKRKAEFQRRGGLALLACLAGHDKTAPDEQFLKLLPLVETACSDERPLVQKGASWALRGMARRKGVRPTVAALARKLSASDDRAERWVGKDVLRGLR